MLKTCPLSCLEYITCYVKKYHLIFSLYNPNHIGICMIDLQSVFFLHKFLPFGLFRIQHLLLLRKYCIIFFILWKLKENKDIFRYISCYLKISFFFVTACPLVWFEYIVLLCLLKISIWFIFHYTKRMIKHTNTIVYVLLLLTISKVSLRKSPLYAFVKFKEKSF